MYRYATFFISIRKRSFVILTLGYSELKSMKQSHTRLYVCRFVRGDFKFYSSENKTKWIPVSVSPCYLFIWWNIIKNVKKESTVSLRRNAFLWDVTIQRMMGLFLFDRSTKKSNDISILLKIFTFKNGNIEWVNLRKPSSK